jgi:uncharacterized membrane protein
MDFQYYGFTLLLIWLQLAGLAAFTGPRVGSWALGRSCGILLLVMMGFLIEHHVGLGSLKGVWVVCAALSGYYLWKKWPELKDAGFINSELVFIIALGYGLLWKYCFPNIYPSAERITDLYFIGNYYHGTSLPPLDNWFPPHKFDFYYALQHYGAALIGRIFSLAPGLTYNISFALLMALPLTLAWDIVGRFLKARGPKILLVAALAIGGTGASIFTHLIYSPPPAVLVQGKADVYNGRMWGSARLIGQYNNLGNTEFARMFFPKDVPGDPKALELPLETFGYMYFVGDYHPPIGGFFLLLLAIGLIMRLEMRPADAKPAVTLAQKAFLVLTVPAAIATNTWIYPLQTALVVSWLGWRYWRSRKENHPMTVSSWWVIIAAGFAGFIFLYPFLAGIGTHGIDTPVKMVHVHSPLIPFIALWWPFLVLLALALFVRDVRRHALFFALVFGLLLLLTEFVFIDDITVGRYERSNTALKWGSWIWTGGLVAIGAPLLADRRRWVSWIAGGAIAGTLVYAVDVYHFFTLADPRFFGDVSAEGVYTQDPPVKNMFGYLKQAPYGIVLENQYADFYSDGGVYAAFSAKPVVMGWPKHLITWRGRSEEIELRKMQVHGFYDGTLPKPADWLRDQDVRYIIWNPRDASRPEVWQRYSQEFMHDYSWQEFGILGNSPVGIWTRRN